ncbi:uncharacterized protein LOC133708663 isoform X2 [Rosa rugosa]|uniref:uncharacterized protein LOC133708663 isoform X2 n=1 Tax=Rosa rugosa TaxID=74645 RepID=UPI002B4068FD|nr:uncharacterized protein LOC133708663 isoform X2 [Rosa rugosa]
MIQCSPLGKNNWKGDFVHNREQVDSSISLGSAKASTGIPFCCKGEKKDHFGYLLQRELQVVSIRYQGHLLAKELAGRGLQTALITDSAIFAMISQVIMVIVGAHAVMANGGVIAPVGLNMVALAAQRHAVPFVVLAGSYKSC